jgi:hypothetical protein
MKRFALFGAAVLVTGALVSAQQPTAAPQKPLSPAGTAAAQVSGKVTPIARGNIQLTSYPGGKWIEISYGRPLKRGRDVFGTGTNYGKDLLVNGATVWRAGANVTTRLNTETALTIGGKALQPGEYSVFIDAKSPKDWTLIVSNWAAQSRYDPNNKDALWGSFGYTPDKDVLRAPMQLSTLPFSVEELTWSFVDMTGNGGKMAIMWDKVMATVPFTVAGS